MVCCGPSMASARTVTSMCVLVRLARGASTRQVGGTPKQQRCRPHDMGRIRHAVCAATADAKKTETSRRQVWQARKLPLRASLAAHLRSGGATEPAKHPSVCPSTNAKVVVDGTRSFLLSQLTALWFLEALLSLVLRFVVLCCASLQGICFVFRD